MIEKETIIEEIDEMMDRYCADCFVKKALISERGKRQAHRFCIQQCTIGEELRFLGKEMLKFSK